MSRLDHVIIKEDEDGRGRPRGAIAALVRAGLEEGGLASDEIEVVYDEMEAVDHVVGLLGEGDLALVTANDVRGVLDAYVERRRAEVSGESRALFLKEGS